VNYELSLISWTYLQLFAKHDPPIPSLSKVLYFLHMYVPIGPSRQLSRVQDPQYQAQEAKALHSFPQKDMHACHKLHQSV
jgi:hypothetical protein